MSCEFNANSTMQQKTGQDVFGRTRDFIRRVRWHTNEKVSGESLSRRERDSLETLS